MLLRATDEETKAEVKQLGSNSHESLAHTQDSNSGLISAVSDFTEIIVRLQEIFFLWWPVPSVTSKKPWTNPVSRSFWPTSLPAFYRLGPTARSLIRFAFIGVCALGLGPAAPPGPRLRTCSFPAQSGEDAVGSPSRALGGGVSAPSAVS